MAIKFRADGIKRKEMTMRGEEMTIKSVADAVKNRANLSDSPEIAVIGKEISVSFRANAIRGKEMGIKIHGDGIKSRETGFITSLEMFNSA
ncbi:MAG: hypothetical protein ABI855_14570 [Bacteroidota bacterium]